MPSSSAVRRIRLAAFLIGAKCLLTPAALGLLTYAMAIGDRDLTGLGGYLLLLAGLMVLLQWLVAARANCPLCMTPVLGNKECAKHRSARKLFGSHRMRVALAVLCLNRFHCPYCGEHCEMKVRQRKPR